MEGESGVSASMEHVLLLLLWKDMFGIFKKKKKIILFIRKSLWRKDWVFRVAVT